MFTRHFEGLCTADQSTSVAAPTAGSNVTFDLLCAATWQFEIVQPFLLFLSWLWVLAFKESTTWTFILQNLIYFIFLKT